MAKIIVDNSKCIGCGSCEIICPQIFELKNGKSTVKKQPEKITCEKEAEAVCPTCAISVEE